MLLITDNEIGSADLKPLQVEIEYYLAKRVNSDTLALDTFSRLALSFSATKIEISIDSFCSIPSSSS